MNSAPQTIRNARGAGLLVLEWADGHSGSLTHARLRALCPCSACRAARLRGRIDAVPVDLRVEAIHQQGYGLQMVFSDGHDRGIFPWQYLYEACTPVA